MPAGTIALTNNSATVTGTGTSFTTELKVNDFLVSTVGGLAYTLGVKSIESNASLTLMEKYTGPSSSGQSWTPVPYGTMAAITAQVAAQVTYAIRGFNLDKANWQQVFTGTGAVTVNLPDGTSWQGPAWGGIASALEDKANTADVLTKADNLKSLTDASNARLNLGLGDLATLNGPLAINKGGTGTDEPFGTTANTFAQGNDARFGTINGKTGGTLSSRISFDGATNWKIDILASSTEVVNGESRNYVYNVANSAGGNVSNYMFSIPGQYTSCVIGVDTSIFQLRSDGKGYSPNGWQTYSDERTKDKKAVIDNPIERLFKLRGYTFEKFGVPGTGVIAQEAQEAVPEAVSNSGDLIRPDNGELIKDALAINPGDLVGLLIEVCRDQEGRIQQRDTSITELLKRMKAIDGLDA